MFFFTHRHGNSGYLKRFSARSKANTVIGSSILLFSSTFADAERHDFNLSTRINRQHEHEKKTLGSHVAFPSSRVITSASCSMSSARHCHIRRGFSNRPDRRREIQPPQSDTRNEPRVRNLGAPLALRNEALPIADTFTTMRKSSDGASNLTSQSSVR